MINGCDQEKIGYDRKRQIFIYQFPEEIKRVHQRKCSSRFRLFVNQCEHQNKWIEFKSFKDFIVVNLTNMSDCLETRKIRVNLYISECVEKNHLF